MCALVLLYVLRCYFRYSTGNKGYGHETKSIGLKKIDEFHCFDWKKQKKVLCCMVLEKRRELCCFVLKEENIRN